MLVSQHDTFYGEELLTPRPTPKLENPPLSAVRNCLFSILAVILNTGGPQSEEAPCHVDRDPLITDFTLIHFSSPHTVYLLVIALHILRLLMVITHDKVLYVIALPVIRLQIVVSCFTTTCYILHNTCVIFRQVRVT